MQPSLVQGTGIRGNKVHGFGQLCNSLFTHYIIGAIPRTAVHVFNQSCDDLVPAVFVGKSKRERLYCGRPIGYSTGKSRCFGWVSRKWNKINKIFK